MLYGACACALGRARAQYAWPARDVLMRMRHMHKMASKASGTPVELSVSLLDSFSECICSKGSSSIRYRVDWYIKHRLQSNQFVGRPVEEEEKEKDGEN